MQKEYKVEVEVSSALLRQVKKWLTTKNPEEFQGESNTVSVTAVFPDGYEMDIKCCGCDDDSSWTEAVLFNEKNGEACCTDPEDYFVGTWELEHDGVKYTVIVKEEPRFVVEETSDAFSLPFIIRDNQSPHTGLNRYYNLDDVIQTFESKEGAQQCADRLNELTEKEDEKRTK